MDKRLTLQRRIIYEELCKTKNHPRADELYSAVRKRLKNISLGTVYRNLKILKEEGKILELKCKGFLRFDGTIENHNHLLCQRCKKIFDIKDSRLSKIILKNILPIKKSLQNEGFYINDIKLDIAGICYKCRR